jgi:hypothetical protein
VCLFKVAILRNTVINKYINKYYITHQKLGRKKINFPSILPLMNIQININVHIMKTKIVKEMLVSIRVHFRSYAETKHHPVIVRPSLFESSSPGPVFMERSDYYDAPIGIVGGGG